MTTMERNMHMSEKTFDIALLRKAVDWARDEHNHNHYIPVGSERPDRWFQGWWGKVRLSKKALKDGEKVRQTGWFAVDQLSCGSTGCLAGHICTLSGDRYVIELGQADAYHIDLLIDVGHVVDSEGHIHSIPERARELLGLDSDWGLFAGENSVEDLETIAAQIAADHGEVW